VPRTRSYRYHRLNWRAAIALAALVVVGSAGSAALWFHQQSRVGQVVIDQATQLDKKGQYDLAVQHLSRYLEDNPDDVAALELRANIMTKSIRGLDQIRAAADQLSRVLRLTQSDGADNPKHLEMRRKLAELYVLESDILRFSADYRLMPEQVGKQFKYRPAADIVEELLKGKGADDADLHQIAATAHEGLAGPGHPEDLERAISEYHQVLARRPGDKLASERLARLYLERKDQPEKAREVMEDLLKARPDDAEVRRLRYDFFTRLQPPRYDLAGAELKVATELAPDDVSNRFLMAEHALRQGDSAEATRQIEALPASLRNTTRTLVIRGKIDLQEGRYEAAIDDWRKGLMASGGTDPQLTLQIALALLQMDRVAEARPLIEQYRRLVDDPDPSRPSPAIQFLEAVLEAHSGYPPARAIAVLEGLRDRVGDMLQERLYLELGRCYSARGEYDKSREAYRQAGEVAPKSPLSRLKRAELLLAKGQFDESVAEIGRALEIADTPDVRVALAAALFQQQHALPEKKRSWASFDQALDLAAKAAPKDDRVIVLRANRLLLDNKLAEAIDVLEKAALAEPQKPARWVAWASRLARSGRADEALKVLERASQPDNAGDAASLRIARAEILLARGHGRQARDLLSRDIDRLPPSERPQIWKTLAQLDILKGDLARARQDYQEWARLFPDDPRPKLSLFDLAEGQGDDEAIRKAVDGLRELGGTEGPIWQLAKSKDLLTASARGAKGSGDAKLLEALEHANAALKENSELSTAHLLRAQIYELLKRPDDAIADYRHASDHGVQGARDRLVALLIQQKRFDELSKLQESEPTAGIDRLSAELALSAGNAPLAAELARKAGEAQPGQVETGFWMAGMLDRLGKPEEAEAKLRALAERRPEQLDPWLLLLQYQVAHNRTRQAHETVQQIKDRVVNTQPEVLAARCSALLGDQAAADRSFGDALRKYPDDIPALLLAARYYSETSQPERAEACLQHVLKLDPRHRQAARQLAEMLSLSSSTPAAWDRAWAVLGPETPDEAPEDRLVRAAVLSRHPDPARRGRAIELLDGLVADLPAALPVATTAREALVRLLLQAGDARRASQVAAPLAQGVNPAAIALYAEALVQNKAWAEAERQLDRLHELAPGDPREARLRALLIWDRSPPEKAAENLARAAEARGTGPSAEALGREAFNLIIQQGPKAAKVAEGLGKHLAKQRPGASWMAAKAVALQGGRHAEVLDLCRAAAAGPHANAAAARADAFAACQVAVNIVTSGDQDPDSLRKVEAVLDAARPHVPPEATELLIMRAMIRRFEGRYDDEVRLYREVLALQPGNLMVLNNLAWALSEGMNQPSEALEHVDEMIRRIGRTSPDSLDTRGVILTRLGRLDEAIKDLEDAVRARTASPSRVFYAHLARAYHKAGQDELFRKYRDLALRDGFSPKEFDPSERTEIEALLKR
jgi:cellulose synthase operon protein C